jgi:hypothetical protein
MNRLPVRIEQIILVLLTSLGHGLALAEEAGTVPRAAPLQEGKYDGKMEVPKNDLPGLKSTLAEPVEVPLGNVIRGGTSADYLSLIDIRRSADKKAQVERLIFDFGDKTFLPSKQISYFTVEYKANPRRVFLQLSLVMSSHFQAENLDAKIKPGLFVERTNLEFDSLGQSHNMTIYLKEPVKVLISKIDGQGERPARLVLDFKK